MDKLERAFERFRSEGDLRALTQVFDLCAPQLLGLARHLSSTREDAEDLLQATFLTAIGKAASWDRERPLLPWLFGILALHAHKLRRQRGRELDVERLAAPASPSPELEARERELVHAVSSAVVALPRGYAAIVHRHLIGGASPAELAADLTDAAGILRVRLPEGPVRFVALPAGTLQPSSLGWSAGTQRIQLRRAAQ